MDSDIKCPNCGFLYFVDVIYSGDGDKPYYVAVCPKCKNDYFSCEHCRGIGCFYCQISEDIDNAEMYAILNTLLNSTKVNKKIYDVENETKISFTSNGVVVEFTWEKHRVTMTKKKL